MSKIQIVKNSDRCHVCTDGVPQATFLFSSYSPNEFTPIEQALNDAKITVFNLLADMQQFGHSPVIDTKIIDL